MHGDHALTDMVFELVQFLLVRSEACVKPMHGFSKSKNFLLNCGCLVEAKPSSLVSELVQARVQLLTHASHLC